MATLILTAVGSAVGGPIGGAIGSILGQRLDQTLFRPKARHGPRLGDLAVQTSSYGGAIPKLFGTMRVAGTVIWSTDLIETRGTSGGGKGRPKTVNYSYSASFAVALSARPINVVGRIWADGKLLRGAAGDFKSSTVFRLHSGDEDQTPDPLIASAEGLGQAPAFRGLAYAVFEDFQLEDYGNRIPSLTFEVLADAGPVAIGSLAAELSGGVIVAGTTPALHGFAASGDSVRGALEALAEAAPMSLSEAGGSLRLTVPDSAPVPVAGSEQRKPRAVTRGAAEAIASEVSVAYYDVERDFQTGLQRAVNGGGAAKAERTALPASLSADAAKAFAEGRLATLRAGRSRASLSLGWARAALRPGAVVSIEGEAGNWAIRRWSLGAMTLNLEVERLPGAAAATAPAAPGQSVAEPDEAHGPTVLRLLDLPLAEPAGDRPTLFAAAAGSEAGWRRAALLASFDGGESWREAGRTAAPAVLGASLDVLGGGQGVLFDHRASVEVELLHPGMSLLNASDEALVGGANLAVLGDELLQFGRAEPLGECRYRLSRLVRGRRGTEWAIDGHAVGDPFTLVEAATLAAIEVPAGSLGGEARLSANGIGDVVPATAEIPIEGRSLLPPSPAHLRATRLSGGDVAISWVRRSRLGWSWVSGADTPLGEETETYRLSITGAGFQREASATAPSFLYDAAMQAADGASGALTIAVRQLGTFGASRPASIILP